MSVLFVPPYGTLGLKLVAAGVLLAAVALELLPPLAAASQIDDMVAIVVGFSMGLLLMVGLEYLIKDEEPEAKEKSKTKQAELYKTSANNSFPIVFAVAVYIDAVVDGTPSTRPSMTLILPLHITCLLSLPFAI